MKPIRNTIFIISIMISVCLILSIIPNYIQGSKINKNLVKSIEIINEDYSKPPLGNIIFFKLDNFTDALMLNIAHNVNSDAPVKSSMENTYYMSDKGIVGTTKNVITGNNIDTTPINYTRYWHGNQLFLRPLLLFMDYNGIRIVNYICLSFIFIYLSILILKRNEKTLFWALCISAIIFNLWIVPLSMQFSTIFYISLSASVILLTCIKPNENEYKHIYPFFIIIGGATSFFDLLTTPLITLGLPLIIYTSVSDKGIKKKYHQIFSCSTAWLLGYSTIWISKWCIAHFIIGYNINDAISTIMFRTSTEYNDFDMSLLGIFHFLSNYAPLALSLATLFAIAFFIFNIILYYKEKRKFIDNSHLLLIALMPFIWCLILRNHSIIHFSFVWRVFYISMISYLLFITKTIKIIK